MITDTGVATITELGIVTEIDLRNEAVGKVTGSAVEGVSYVQCPMASNVSYYDNNRESVVKVFELLADENNYPIVFHCAIGTDRTGYVAFLINALLGVEREGIYRDYLFSNFGNIGAARGLSGVKIDYMDRIMQYGNGTIAENCEAFLLDIGVQQEHIDAVRAILLENNVPISIWPTQRGKLHQSAFLIQRNL